MLNLTGFKIISIPAFDGAGDNYEVRVRWSEVQGPKHAKNVDGIGRNVEIKGPHIVADKLFQTLIDPEGINLKAREIQQDELNNGEVQISFYTEIFDTSIRRKLNHAIEILHGQEIPIAETDHNTVIGIVEDKTKIDPKGPRRG